ncbi:endonuclease 8-like 3 [Patella vulgata]|uniref:endonuclease 8-like 3 n=1 Tax=Patella vulgata TaxID=6465 RepID=UPI00217F95E3|nr:endonuclease 8-like 3 [Patella vulgata]
MLVDELKPEHISNIIKMTRDFTMIFYQCRKTGKPLNKYYRIYAQETCKSCGTRVTKTRMGDDSGRVTYFCSSCQTADTSKLDKLTLPSKNSLLSWVKTANCKTEVDWSCPVCTLVNKVTHLSCDACLGPKPNQSDIPVQRNGIQDQSNSSLSRKETAIDQSNSFLAIDLKFKSTQEPKSLSLDTAKKVIAVSSTDILSSKNSFQGSKKRKSSDSQDSTQPQFNNKKIKKENVGTENNVKNDLNSKFPNCSQHGKKCSLWQTHKPGPNRNRWFFTCSIKGPKKCNYFEWCDKRFPACSGHGKTCGYHTVLKLGANNGRKFFTCSLPKKEQCEFFEWADGFGDVVTRK